MINRFVGQVDDLMLDLGDPAAHPFQVALPFGVGRVGTGQPGSDVQAGGERGPGRTLPAGRDSLTM
jgi:hypothetical protein